MPAVATLKEMERYRRHNSIYLGGGPNHTAYWGIDWSTERYRKVITRLLDDIGEHESGRALLGSIRKRILIIPVREGTSDLGDLMGSARPIGSIDLVSYAGNVSNLSSLTPASGAAEAEWNAGAGLAGQGTEYLVQFTPGFYDRSSPLAQAFAGRYEADSVLFHELVHASRGTSGTFDRTPLSGPLPIGDMNRYTNVDEFVAILLANIYRSEKYRTMQMRASHAVNFESYRNPRNLWRLPEFQNMMDLFAHQNPSLFWEFAHKAYAQWNPIRDYHRSMADETCSLHGGR